MTSSRPGLSEDDVHVYNATVDSSSRYLHGVYDGDTIDMLIDVGFGMYSRQRIRVLGVNTPELRGDDKQEGQRFKQLTLDWMIEGWNFSNGEFPFIIRTEKSDSFGRYLADITRKSDSQSLTQYLLGKGSPEYK